MALQSSRFNQSHKFTLFRVVHAPFPKADNILEMIDCESLSLLESSYYIGSLFSSLELARAQLFGMEF